MREKIIYDGHIDGSQKEVQEIVDLFLLENFHYPDIDFRVEHENQKQLWLIHPSNENNQQQEKLINGFIEINTIFIADEKPVNFRLVSCRQVLDLLFFQLSQRIQAKFIIRDFPPDVLTTPWKDLITQGLISPLSTTVEGLLLNKVTNPKGKVPKYGTFRDLTEEEVVAIVAKCKIYQKSSWTVRSYYEKVLTDEVRGRFSLGTLIDWGKNKKFNHPAA